jgi:hypothetical protein
MQKSNFAIDIRWMRFNALKLASSFPIFAASCASVQQCFKMARQVWRNGCVYDVTHERAVRRKSLFVIVTLRSMK